jgi:hypothetical protein
VFCLQNKTPKEIHTILTEKLGEHTPLYAAVKNGVARFKLGNFYTCDAPRPGRPMTVTTSKNIDQIHKLFLEGHRILAKLIAEQLDISLERGGSIIHENIRVVGHEMPERGSKTSTVRVV